MAQTVSDFVVDRLHHWGVNRIFGYPGDGINGLMGALGRAEDRIRFIQARHEELAAFMACAHAKFTGEIGVCMATSGPGAIHLLNGLYDAQLDHQPVLAIVGQQKTSSLGSDYQQEVDLPNLFKDVAHHFVQTCMNPAQARHLLDRAVRIARAERAVTCLIFPNDVQELEAVGSPPRKHGSVYTSIGYSDPIVVPREQDLRAAADVLNAGEKVAILIGAGARDAADEVVRTADVLGSCVAKALLGKDVLPDDLPFVTGAIGLLGTKPSDVMMKECDTLLMVGTTFPYAEFLPKEGQARGVQIDLKPRNLGLRYAAEVNLCGDAKATLSALLPLLVPKQDRSFRDKIEREIEHWWQLLERRAMAGAHPINPERVFWELSSRLPDRCIVTSDSGSAANWYARDLKLRAGMLGSLSGNLATMCPAVPYAIAAKFAYPDRPVVACVGDGAMQMLGNNALITAGRHWPEWTDKRLIVLVLNNGDLNLVTWEQRVGAGEPKFEASQELPEFSYARYAELCGFESVVMKSEADVVPGWEKALAADRPVLVEAYTDPEVPPLPPHITLEQAVHYWRSVFKGDPNRWHFLKHTAQELAGGLKRG